jgi:hypothetical protein
MRTAAFGIAAAAVSLLGWGLMPVANTIPDLCPPLLQQPGGYGQQQYDACELARQRYDGSGQIPGPQQGPSGPVPCVINGTPAERAVCGDQAIMGQAPGQ